MVAKPRSAYLMDRTLLKQSAKSKIKLWGRQDVVAYDRTVSKLPSELFWGVQRPGRPPIALGSGAVGPGQRRRPSESSASETLKVIGASKAREAKPTNVFEKLDIASLAMTSIEKMMSIYSHLQKFHVEDLVPSESVQFFQIEFMNFILSSCRGGAPRAGSETRTGFPIHSAGPEYLGRLEYLFRHQLSTLVEPGRVPEGSPSQPQVGWPSDEPKLDDGGLDADATEHWHDEEINSRQDGLDSPDSGHQHLRSRHGAGPPRQLVRRSRDQGAGQLEFIGAARQDGKATIGGAGLTSVTSLIISGADKKETSGSLHRVEEGRRVAGLEAIKVQSEGLTSVAGERLERPGHVAADSSKERTLDERTFEVD